MAKQPTYRINLRWYRILYFPILLPVALALALFNKISPVPLTIYLLRVERIGQMSGNIEEFLCKQYHNLLPREFRVYVYRDHPSNTALLRLIERVVPVRNYLLPLFDVCHKLGGLGVISHECARLKGQDRDQLIHKTPQFFSLTDQEEQEARAQCRQLGIGDDELIIPVLGRDTAYLDHIKEPTVKNSYRNVDINTFVPAMEALSERFRVVRMGSVVNGPLKTDNPRILDYSLSGKRTELLDVYFPARCHFFLTCGTGPDAIASFNFRRPVLYVNYIPVDHCAFIKDRCLAIPKKYWHMEEERYLTLSEVLAVGAQEMAAPSALTPLGITILDNTPEEITEVCEEMVARLDGTWVESEEDRYNQEKFWSHFTNHSPKYANIRGRIGAAYLRQNPFWLE